MPAIHPISALPAFVSPDQHASLVASTPASFNDIPPIARHQEQNVTLALDPPLSEFSGDDLKGSLYVLTR
jgi:nucleotide-sensitive chloride channel 1A